MMAKEKRRAPVQRRDKAKFFEKAATLIEQARAHVRTTANLAMCITYFELGRMIVEQEQNGKARAEYGRSLLLELSEYLNGHFGKGFSETNLKNFRKFYLVYDKRIRQTLSAESNGQVPGQPIWQTLSAESNSQAPGQSIQQTLSAELEKTQIRQSKTSELYPFKLSWSHYQVLIRIENEQERAFYEIEAANQQWSVRQLQRQYGSSLYERLALSRNKDEVVRLARKGQTIEKPQDMLKNPLVLEFLGLEEDSAYSESDLETAIISKLQKFLLELGKGFLFEARQKRFTFDEEHFMVDLVFYNRLLSCYVLIDLKTGKLEHQDLGQMQMYVNYFDRYVRTKHENPTVGILLCREKNDSVVKLTLPENANIYASEYRLYLPDKTLLQQKLDEWIQEFEEAKEILETPFGKKKGKAT
jgi:predicted nuclease of restriction endonuclease-like (RecB) superfamily